MKAMEALLAKEKEDLKQQMQHQLNQIQHGYSQEIRPEGKEDKYTQTLP